MARGQDIPVVPTAALSAVTGQILDADGEPLKNASVYAFKLNPPPAHGKVHVHTDVNGRFVING